jgi:hypothetical protein
MDYLGNELQSLTYLIAGAPTMVEGVVGTLHSAGVAEAQLRPERLAATRRNSPLAKARA